MPECTAKHLRTYADRVGQAGRLDMERLVDGSGISYASRHLPKPSGLRSLICSGRLGVVFGQQIELRKPFERYNTIGRNRSVQPGGAASALGIRGIALPAERWVLE